MAHYSEILGEVVDDIRLQRRAGEKVSQIVAYLATLGLHISQIGEYLDQAFGLSGDRPSLLLMPVDANGLPKADVLDRRFGPVVDKAHPRWARAEPYPDLLRRRDRHTFREVAVLTDTILIVRAADRHIARYIGRPKFYPCPPYLAAVARATEPNRGLMAADPNDPRFLSFLSARFPNLSYRQYADSMAGAGFHVASAEEGYIIRGSMGQSFYLGYQLIGAYSGPHHRSAWTGRKGEMLRGLLNCGFGEELIQWGPYNQAEYRTLEPAAPALVFYPDGQVETRLTDVQLGSLYRDLRITA
jgi:hypothetical protein